jgi:hypothetical protein
MKHSEFYQFIANPAMLTGKTLPDLKQLVNDFPYFHAVRMLYLTNLAIAEDLRLAMEIKRMAIHIPDRMKLFWLIEGEPHKKTPETVDNEKSFHVVENFLTTSEEPDSKPAGESLLIEPASSFDYMQWLLADNQPADTSQAKFEHQELIDTFIANKNGSARRRKTAESVQSDYPTDEKMEEKEKSEKSLDSSYFTETLASVYIKQKRYEKALEIIKSLNLKYPEKNVYFADQIRFLEKLIIHTKK